MSGRRVKLDPVTEERIATLRAFLNKHEARCNWQQSIPRVGMLSCYTARGVNFPRVFLVMVYGDGDGAGYECYIPASDSPHVATTLRALAEYINREAA